MKQIRILLIVFITLLVLSGVTAFPLRTEMELLNLHKNAFPNALAMWIETVYDSIKQTPDVVLYGTDWLAFAHIIIALFFIPVYINPIKNKANLIVAMVACGAVFILAFVCGPIRGIPFFSPINRLLFWFYRFYPTMVRLPKS